MSSYEDLRPHIGHNVAVVCYTAPGATDPANIAIECEDCSLVLVDHDHPDMDESTVAVAEGNISEPTSADTIIVEVTLEADGAWEVWEATVPADATDEWIRANFPTIEHKQFSESGNDSYTVTEVER